MNESDQLSRIFGVLGTPGDQEWPSDTDVLRENFANHRSRDFQEILPEIEPEAKDLLQVKKLMILLGQIRERQIVSLDKKFKVGIGF